MKYLNHDLRTPYQGQNFKIKKEYDDVFFYYNEGFYAESRYSFMVDDLTSDYSSALVVGLGLGVIPQWLANEKGAIVDVVE